MEIKKICVVGGGLMGRQIALCASIHGFDATVYDLKPEVLDAVQVWEDEYLAGRIAKGRMTEEQVAAIWNLLWRRLFRALTASSKLSSKWKK